MKKPALAGLCLVALAIRALGADIEPLSGKDYYSLQIASDDRQNLEKSYAKYAVLPYLRIEQRDGHYVMRAGFWDSASQARKALAELPVAKAFVRVAAFRPDAIVRRNWTANTAVSPPTAPPTLTLAKAMPAQAEPPAANSAAQNIRLASPGGDLRPFNQEDYALAFDVFVGNGDLNRAYLVASEAVASVPNDLAWRLKLARLADWTRRPDAAWENWEYLFRNGDRGDETLNAVLRLAPFVNHPEMALEVWKIRMAHVPLTPAQWNDIRELFEIAAQPQQGSRFFEEQYRSRHDIALLDVAAKLAENAGDDERALRLYSERTDVAPFSVDAVLHAVVILFRLDRLREAYALMEAHRTQVPADAADFWRNLGRTAWDLMETDATELAYRNYVKSKQAELGDWARLILLVRQHHPAEAADLSLEAYRRYGAIDYLVEALAIDAESGNLGAQERILKSLVPEAVAKAEQNTRFLVLRAQYHQARSEPEAAWADLRRALALSPDAADAMLAALWFTIDTHRPRELESLLRAAAPRAQTDSGYWLAFAAANQELGRAKESIYWYGREVARNPDDNLLLLNYADALERVQNAGMAERVRRHAWLRLREKFPAPDLALPLDKNPQLLALARLAILNQPGDPGLALVRDVASRLRGLPADHATNATNAQTRDLILGWAISKEQFINARAWMWLHYARSLDGKNIKGTPPKWGESQTALQLNDTQTLDRLLNRDAEGMPIYNRYDSAYALEHWPQALDIAFRGMEANDVDEDLYDRYRQHVPQHADYLQFRASKDRYGVLNSVATQIEARLFPYRKLELLLGWSRLRQSSGDADIGPFAPATDQLTSIEGRWLGSRGDTRLALFRRNELEANTGWRLGQNWTWDNHLQIGGGLELKGDATDSLPLRVGGYEKRLYADANYAIGKREYVRLAPQLIRYYTQQGEYLGNGRVLDLEAGYRIRTEYPDWRVRGFATRQSYSYNGAVGAQTISRLPPDVQSGIALGNVDPVHYFIPEGSTTWGVCLGMGDNLAGQNIQEVYTRAWRHFYEVCKGQNSLNGPGYTGMLGIAGSVTGEDHVSLRLEQSRGGPGSGGMNRTLAVRYRRYF